MLNKLIWKPKIMWRDDNGHLFINPVIAIGSICLTIGIVIGLLI